MKKFLMIAAMAMVATVACDKTDTPDVDPTAPKATIVASPASVAVEASGAFNVTLSEAAKEEVVITVTNANADFLTVAATEIKIAAGATTGSVTFTGKAEGAAKVSFSANAAAQLQTPELTVTVTKKSDVEVSYEYPMSAWGTYFGMSKAVFGTTTITASCASDEKGADKPLLGNDDFAINGVSDDKTATIVPFTEGMAFTIYADNFTSTNGKYDVFVYVDWNGDGKFDGAGELVKNENGIDGAKKSEITGTITIPATAVASSRVRIIIANEEQSIEDGIGDMDSGYMMDFMYSK